MRSSIFSTLRLLVHPVEPHGSVDGVRQVAHRERALRLQPFQDVAAAGVVGLHPVAPLHLPGAELARPRPDRHVGAVEREVLRGPDQRLQLEERPVRRGRCAARPRVRRPQPAPHDQVGARRDRGDRVELEEGQVAARDRATRPVARRRAAAPARRSARRRSGRAGGSLVTPRDDATSSRTGDLIDGDLVLSRTMRRVPVEVHGRPIKPDASLETWKSWCSDSAPVRLRPLGHPSRAGRPRRPGPGRVEPDERCRRTRPGRHPRPPSRRVAALAPRVPGHRRVPRA